MRLELIILEATSLEVLWRKRHKKRCADSKFGEVLNVFVVFHQVLQELLVIGIELEFVWFKENDPTIVVSRVVYQVRVDFHFAIDVGDQTGECHRFQPA